MDYLLHIALTHTAFRLPELLAVCECLAIGIQLPAEEEERAVHRPFLVVKLESDEEARRLASRCILVKSIMQLPVGIPMSFSTDFWGRGLILAGPCMLFGRAEVRMRSCMLLIGDPRMYGPCTRILRSDSLCPP
jgi:hypothetical protein